VIEKDDYFNLGANLYTTAPYIGQGGTNYYVTKYGYNSTGQLNYTLSPPGPLGQPGTIHRTVYDVLGREASTWVGTNDTGATDSDPTGGHAANNNMVQVSANTYDGYTLNGVTYSWLGDSLLTQQTVSPRAGATPRTTQYVYDWRDRLIAEKDGVLSMGNENHGTHRPIYVATYDTQDHLTMVQQYDGDTVTIVNTNGNFIAPSFTLLRAQSTQSYDAQGRVYQSSTYSVDPSSGTVGPALVTNTWYDRRGNPIKVSEPSGLVTKTAYDSVERLVTVYTTDGAGDQTWADASSVANNYVLQQVETTYDANSNPILVTTRDRFHNETLTGPLSDPSGGSQRNLAKARASYIAAYYDPADRATATADFGTDGALGPPTIGSSPPPPSDQVLVNSSSYQLDAVQTVALFGHPNGGTFTLTFNGETTNNQQYPLYSNATAAAVQAALGALSNVNGYVSVTGPAGGPWVVQFTGSVGEQQNIQQMTGDGSGLMGGTNPGVFTAPTDTGRAQKTTDPRGLIARADYDLLGRTVQTIANVTTGVPSAEENITTQYAYDGDNHVVLLTAVQPNGGVQQTQYNYGYSSSGVISSNDLLRSVQYPDRTTGLPSTQAADQESFQYDAVEQTQHTDRSGNVHAFSYDVLGRPITDAVNTLGIGVDPAVQRLDTAYDTQGNAYLFTSYSTPAGGSSNIVNQVQDAFNGLGQLTAETQIHGNPNNPNAPQGIVGYAYDQTTATDSTGLYYVDGSRLVGMTYPNNRVLDYVYNTGTGAAGLDGRISRLSFLADVVAGRVTTHLEEYTYLGLDTVVQRAHPEPGINLTYIQQPGDTGTGDAGDQYTGLDRFGRVVDQRWVQAANPQTPTDRFQYGYDRDSRVNYKNNRVNSYFSELYHVSGAGNGYDGLNQLLSFSRGQLTASIQNGPLDTVANPSRSQSWSLDTMGNSTNLATTFNGTTTPQSRNHNAQNQVTSVTVNSNTATLTFDSNGNTTTDENGQQYVYDAWNRLVAVKSQGGSLLETYHYDALGRRVQETTSAVNRDLYFNSAWQVVEEDAATGGPVTRLQYVWDPLASDTLVLRDRPDVNGNIQERLYVQQDANGDVTAVVDGKTGSPTLGQVQERYIEDPYGQVSFLDNMWQVHGSGPNGTSSVNWVYLHQGGRYDPTSGLYNFRNRDYSPTLGRWMRVDPLGYAGGDANLYRAEGNGPTNVTDPSGLHYPSDNPPAGEKQIPDALKWKYAEVLDNLHHSLLSNLRRLQGAAGTFQNWQRYFTLTYQVGLVRAARSKLVQSFGPLYPGIPNEYNESLSQYAPADLPKPPPEECEPEPLPPSYPGIGRDPDNEMPLWMETWYYGWDMLPGGPPSGSGGPRAQNRSPRGGGGSRGNGGGGRRAPSGPGRDAPKYPKKAGKIENHHVKPIYLGGDRKGPTVPLDGSYHQEITNAIRDAFPYGKGPYPDKEVDEFLKKLYKELFPLK
jgi:RHS repeat-associated protein